MSAFFGRRHSIAGESPVADDALPARMLPRRSSAPSIHGQDKRFQARIRDFFRRHRRSSEDSSASVSLSPRQHQTTSNFDRSTSRHLGHLNEPVRKAQPAATAHNFASATRTQAARVPPSTN
ncbi:hypothetical protein BJX65DRAFT_45699 [Aspergillus insuetus]